MHGQAVGMRGNKGLRCQRSMIARSILYEDHRAAGGCQHARQKRTVAFSRETLSLPLIEQATREVINQPKDLVALAFATCLDKRLLARRCPAIAQRTPLGETCLIAKQQACSLLLCG